MNLAALITVRANSATTEVDQYFDLLSTCVQGFSSMAALYEKVNVIGVKAQWCPISAIAHDGVIGLMWETNSAVCVTKTINDMRVVNSSMAMVMPIWSPESKPLSKPMDKIDGLPADTAGTAHYLEEGRSFGLHVSTKGYRGDPANTTEEVGTVVVRFTLLFAAPMIAAAAPEPTPAVMLPQRDDSDAVSGRDVALAEQQ